MKPSVQKIIRISISIVIIIGALFLVYTLGFKSGLEQTKKIEISGVSHITNDQEAADFNLFWETWNVLKSKYVSSEKVEDNQALVYGAIQGLVASLGDQNSVFFPPEDAQEFTNEIAGHFSGIGAEIGLNENRQLIIVAPLANTPAEKAGVEAGDHILKIDGETTQGFNTAQAVQKIRGEIGTDVTLTIFREGEGEKEITITRARINLPTLDFKRLNRNGEEDHNGDIAYIRIYNFYEQAPFEFQQAALKALLYGSKGIVLDLRNNPGGYLHAATFIGGWFVEKGDVIVKEEFREPTSSQTFVSQGPSLLSSKPVAVLINKGSASASEIVAGALKEQNNATIIGETSFGKGTVQELVPLSGKAMVKVTIAHWLTPQGHQINGNGISPDIALEKDATQDPTIPTYSAGTDSWIKKAVETLNGKIN